MTESVATFLFLRKVHQKIGPVKNCTLGTCNVLTFLELIKRDLQTTYCSVGLGSIPGAPQTLPRSQITFIYILPIAPEIFVAHLFEGSKPGPH